MLLDKIKSDLKQSMKDKNEERKDALRMVIGEVPRLNKKVGEEVTDDDVLKIIKKLIKAENIILQYRTVDTSPMIDILSEYLPKMMSEEEIREWIMNNIDLLPDKKMKAMGEIMKSLKGRADGFLVREVLSKL
jgi:hypothetical protein